MLLNQLEVTYTSRLKDDDDFFLKNDTKSLNIHNSIIKCPMFIEEREINSLIINDLFSIDQYYLLIRSFDF